MKTNIRVAGIIIENNKLLVVRMCKSSGCYYVLPGGGVESNETIIEALIRELNEEISITPIKYHLKYIREVKDNKGDRGIELYFVVTKYVGDIKVGYDPENKEVQIVDVEFADISGLQSLKFHPAQLIELLPDFNLGDKQVNYLGLVSI